MESVWIGGFFVPLSGVDDGLVKRGGGMRQGKTITRPGKGGGESGATMVEYILLLILLVISIVASLQVIEQQLSSSFSSVGSGLRQ